MSKLTDHQQKELDHLVRQMNEGNLQAFKEIYVLFYNKLLRYGLVIVSDQKTVEDEVQNLFIWVLEHPQKMEKVSNLEVYLFRALKNNLRHQQTRNLRSNTSTDEFLAATQSLHIHSAEHQFIQQEQLTQTTNWIKMALANLPPRQREIIHLRFYEGLSYDEIAKTLSTTNQVVRNYVARAMKRIRKIKK